MRLWLLGLVGVLVSSCGGIEAEADGALRAYNEALVLAYRTSDPTVLADVASERELQKVWVLIDLKKSNRLVLESTLEALEVTAAESCGTGCMVARTRERWRYYDRPLDPGRPPGTVFVVDTTLRYELVRREGRWEVAKGETLTNDYLEPPGYRPEEHRPHGTQQHQASTGENA
jgi:hypothetical protein